MNSSRTSSSDNLLFYDKYGDQLLIGMRNLLENDLLCDLTLVAENEAVNVHKVVMAASSDYFRALLTLDMKERGQNVITLKGVPLKGLKSVVGFAYSGHLHCTGENISEVLVAATHLQLSEAIELCGNYLMNLTNNSNCVDMYNLADQFNLVSVKEKALDFVLTHFEDIAERPDFAKLNEKFLAQVCSDNRLRVFSEMRLFELVLRWINCDIKERKQHTFLLMSQIRFPLIPTDDLVNTVMNEPLMKVDSHCLELILEANKYHMLPDKQPVMQSPRTQVRTDKSSLVIMDVDDEGPRILHLGTMTWTTLRYADLTTFHAQVCVLNNYMYVCGGIELYSSSTPVSGKCYRYDPRFDNWVSIATMREPRHHFTLNTDGKSLFAIGGYCSGAYMNVVEEFKVNENQWISRTPMDLRLSASASAEHQGKIYVTGGQTDKGISRCLWVYNPKHDKWFGKAPMFHPRMDHTMCASENQLYVVGGYDKNIFKAFDLTSVEGYDLETEQWSVIIENAPKLSGIYSALLGFKLYMVGGFSYDDNKKKKTVHCFNLKNKQWSTVARIQNPAMSVQCCALDLPRNIFADVTV